MTNVSIIIPSYNGVSLLKKHLPQVLASMRQGDELIIVDDASTDASVAWLQEKWSLEKEKETPDVLLWSGKDKKRTVKVLVNRTNQRFASSCNRGVASAKHELVILLNSDVSPEADFLEYLLPHFEDSQVFAVGCKELATNEDNKEYGRAGGAFMRGFLVHWHEDDQTRTDTLWVAGGSGAFRKSMWEELKGFDLDYKPAYWEDIDLSWRARARGWKVLFEPKSVVHHVHESTNQSIFGQQRMEVMGYKNSILFMWKNARGIELLKHILWLPYHLIFTTVRSKGRFLQGFMAALTSL